MDLILHKSSEDLRACFFALTTARSVANLLEIKWSTLTWHLYRRGVDRAYKRFDIAKKSGGHRTIHAPITPLKIIQRKLCYILQEAYSAKPAVYGFVRNKDIKANADVHIGKPFVINVDLKGFFPTINFGVTVHGLRG